MFWVEWVQTVLDQVTTYWTNADTDLRKAITAACHRIDLELAADPFKDSESREGDERVAFFAPLTVTFSVHETRRRVIISNLKLFKKRQRKK